MGAKRNPKGEKVYLTTPPNGGEESGRGGNEGGKEVRFEKTTPPVGAEKGTQWSL